MKIISNGIEATLDQYVELMTGLAKPSPINNGLFGASIITEAHVLGDLYRLITFKNPLTVRSADAESDPIANVLIQSSLPARPSVGAALSDGLELGGCRMKCGRETVSWPTLYKFLQSWRSRNAVTESLIPVASAEMVMPEYQQTFDNPYTDGRGWAIKLQNPLKLLRAGRVIRSIDRIFVVTAGTQDEDEELQFPNLELRMKYVVEECLTYHTRFIRGFSPTAKLSRNLTVFFGGRKAKDQLWYGPNSVRMAVETSFNTEILASLGVEGFAPYQKGRTERLLDNVEQFGRVQGRTIDDLEANFFRIYRD